MEEVEEASLEPAPEVAEERAPEPPDVVLTIRWVRKEQQLKIEGPIDDRFTCYALLELARELIHERGQMNRLREASQRIVPAHTVPSARHMGKR